MPVLVAARPSALATGVVRRVLQEGGEVRAYGPGAEAARGSGAIVATGTLDDEGRLEAAMAQVHTVVHLPRGILAADPESIAAEARTLVTAAVNAGVRRVISLALPGATATAADPVRRAHAEAVAVLASAPLPTVVVAPSLVDSPVLRDVLAGVSLSTEVRATAVVPIRVADLVELIAAFDAVRSEAHEGHVTFYAPGRGDLTLGGYLERVGITGSRVGRRYLPPGAHPHLIAALAGPWVATDEDVPDAWRFTGLTPRPVD